VNQAPRDAAIGIDSVTATAVPHGTSARYVWYVIGLLTVVNVFSYMDRMALAVLAPYIKVELHLSDAQLGLLTGLAFSLFYAMCGIPIARLADRSIRTHIIAASLTVWSVATALSGAAQNFWHLFTARVGIGAGEAGCFPTAQAVICDYVPLKKRSGVFAIHNFGNYAGMMVGMVLAGWLGEIIGWRWTFVALGLPGIALALLVGMSLREPTRGVFDAVKESGARLPFTTTLLVLWNCKPFRLITCLYALNGFMQYGLNQWWPSFFARSHHLNLSSIGVQLGLAIGVGSGIGSLCGGLMANKVAQRDVRLPLIIGAVATLIALPTALASLFVESATAAMLLIFVTAIFWSVFNGPAIATATSVVSSRMRATAGSINIFAASVLGFGLGPFCVGLLSDVLVPAYGTESLRYALLAPACMLPVMSIVLYAAARALPENLDTKSD
jgi:predicted MFS family arabinose efflux permease